MFHVYHGSTSYSTKIANFEGRNITLLQPKLVKIGNLSTAGSATL